MTKALLAASVVFVAMPGTAIAGSLTLNTGYDYSIPGGGLLGIGAQDQTWIKIASYEPSTPLVPVAVAPAWVVPTGGFSTLPGARWLAPRSSVLSTTGPNSTSPSRPAYSIFRKCFCLLDTAGAQLSLRVRADDNVQVWLNSVLNTLVPPQPGQLSWGSGIPYPSLQYPHNSGYFRVGRNCIYVLVEDNVAGGAIGFTLAGTVSAPGLMPNAATGVNGNFGRCGCPTEANSADDGPDSATGNHHDDSTAVQAIVSFAKGRSIATQAASVAVRPQP